MGRLIDDLLKLSQLTKSEMHYREVDLSAQALEAVETLQRHEPQRAVECIIQEGLTARGDEVLLRNVIENLLGNAWKFTGRVDRARIEFGRCETPRGQAFFVRDNGVGFGMAYVSKLFGAFQRLHSQSEFPGTGIGLATVHRVIHRHGGQVWAEAAPGEGATFYFQV
jgi:light-regulated signal transduction histidine kinase (bacteriophytochrome)